MYIGVAGYCVTPNAQYVNFTLTATLLQLKNDIFKIPQLNQLVAAKGANQYQFCVDKKVDVIAQMKSFTNACDCPSTYANLEYVISRTHADARINDLTWKFQAGQSTGIVKLLAQDADTRPGTYFLNILGFCKDESKCHDKCTCGPCANVAASEFALYVDYSDSFALLSNSSLALGSCTAIDTTSGSTGICGNVCPLVTSPIIASPSFFDTMSSSRIAVAISASFLMLVTTVIGGCLYLRHKQSTVSIFLFCIILFKALALAFPPPPSPHEHYPPPLTIPPSPALALMILRDIAPFLCHSFHLSYLALILLFLLLLSTCSIQRTV